MTESMFDGFDHTQHREEVEQRWGEEAYARSEAWYRGMSEGERRDWMGGLERLSLDWITLAQASDITAISPQAQELARRHVDWLRAIPGTPAAAPNGDLAAYVRGLAEMYAADKRFAANYGGPQGAAFVRDALLVYVERTG